MNLKMALATTTAIGLLVGAAAAGDNNQATVEQDGSNNSAMIEQSGGDGNRVGNPVTSTVYGNITQTGDDNVLDITQEGNSNDVARWSGGSDGNVRQNGDRNAITILQQNDGPIGQSVGGVFQTSNEGTETTNSLNIEQTHDGVSGRSSHAIRKVSQTNDLASVTDADDTNVINVLQSGTGHQQGNAVRTASQNGSSNSQGIEQIGQKNYINSITQTGPGNALTVYMNGTENVLLHAAQTNSGGAENTASISLDGIQNGAGIGGGVPNWAPWSIPASPTIDPLSAGAGAAGVTSAELSQIGNGNAINYSALGNYNLFGFSQDGTSNQAIGISIIGNGNQLGVNQMGTDNVLTLAAINGDDNNLGLRQDGTENSASITISAGGSRNGGFNDFSNPGVAGDLASSEGLTAGLLEQVGINNQVTLNVTGSDNVFATLQDNSLYVGPSPQNVIEGTVDGNSNEAAVVQVGNNNTTSFAQTGGMNYISVNQ